MAALSEAPRDLVVLAWDKGFDSDHFKSLLEYLNVIIQDGTRAQRVVLGSLSTAYPDGTNSGNLNELHAITESNKDDLEQAIRDVGDRTKSGATPLPSLAVKNLIAPILVGCEGNNRVKAFFKKAKEMLSST